MSIEKENEISLENFPKSTESEALENLSIQINNLSNKLMNMTKTYALEVADINEHFKKFFHFYIRKNFIILHF